MARVSLDIFESPVAAIVCELERDGFRVDLRPDGRVGIAPRSRLTPARMREIVAHCDALRALLRRVFDAGVQERREAFRQQLDAPHPGVLVPALLFRPGVPYTLSLCFSCGDGVPGTRFGRCWRCAVALRLALRVPISVETLAAYDEARLSG